VAVQGQVAAVVDQADQAVAAQIGQGAVDRVGLEPPDKVETVVRLLEAMQVAAQEEALLSQVETEPLAEVV
tara:strand:- start:274 stop:486 length:213 start_codon:yes stop_codon:yes gene_type:complete